MKTTSIRTTPTKKQALPEGLVTEGSHSYSG